MGALTVLDLTALDAVLKEQYPVKDITEVINKEILLLQRIDKTGEGIDATGRRAVVPLKHGFNQGVGARAEGGTLPAAGAARFKDTIINLKRLYGKAKLSGIAVKLTASQEGAFARAIDIAMEDLIDSFKKDVNRQLQLEGTGNMARVLSVAGQVITLDRPLEEPTKYLAMDMKVDIKTASGGTTHLDSGTIDSVDPDTNTITMIVGDDISLVVAGDLVFREDSDTYEMMGLRGIIDHNLVDSLQGIARSSYPWWKSAYIDDTTTVLSTDVMRTLLRKVRRYVGTRKDFAYYMTLELFDKLGGIKENDKRFYGTMKVEGGLEVITYLGIPIFTDPDFYPRTLDLLCEKLLVMVSASDFEWAVGVMGNIWQPCWVGASGTDEYEALLFTYKNLATYNPRGIASARTLDWTQSS